MKTLEEIRKEVHMKVLAKSACAKDCGESTVVLMGFVVDLIFQDRKERKEELEKQLSLMSDMAVFSNPQICQGYNLAIEELRSFLSNPK